MQPTNLIAPYLADGAVTRHRFIKEVAASGGRAKAAIAGVGEKPIGIATESAADGASFGVIERGLAMLAVSAGAPNATRSGATLTGGAAAVPAEGGILFNANPDPGDTLNLGSDTPNWTFVADSAVGPQTNIQGSLAATLAQLVTDLNGAGAPFNAVTWSEDDTSLLAVHDTPGAAGNAYQIGGSGDVTPTGATLEDGADAVPAIGHIQMNENVALGDVWELNGSPFTWVEVEADAGADEINRGETLDLSGAAAATKLNASADTDVDDATYAYDADTNRLNVTHDTPGTGGNSFTLVVSSTESEIAVGDLIKPGPDGYGIKAETDGDFYGAIAKAAATEDGAVIPVRVERGYYAAP